MAVLNRPIRVWHAILALAAIGVIVVAGSALAGGSGGGDRALPAKAAFKGSPFHYVGQVATNAGHSQTVLTQPCPKGTIPIAGGGGGASETQGDQALVYSNLADGPDSNSKPDSWLVAVDNQSNTDLQASVEAICVDK